MSVIDRLENYGKYRRYQGYHCYQSQYDSNKYWDIQGVSTCHIHAYHIEVMNIVDLTLKWGAWINPPASN